MRRYAVRRVRAWGLGLVRPPWWPDWVWVVLTPAGDWMPGAWQVLSRHFTWHDAIRDADARVMNDWVNAPAEPPAIDR